MLRFVYLLKIIFLFGKYSFLFIGYLLLDFILYFLVSFAVDLSLLNEFLKCRLAGWKVDILRISIAIALNWFSNSTLVFKVLVLLPNKILQILIDNPINPFILVVDQLLQLIFMPMFGSILMIEVASLQSAFLIIDVFTAISRGPIVNFDEAAMM